jgi:hypothetical protein
MTELQKTGDVFHIMLVYQKKMGSLFDEELAVADSNGFWFRCPLPGCP